MTASLPASTRLGRYEIKSKLGAGGMGEIYLARDTQLDRLVALKILSAAMAEDQQRLPRFIQEARAASALSHPNVAHIYEIDSVELNGEEIYFIAMELIEGEPLDLKIGGRPLENSLLVDFAIQIADALDEAHARGIVHRDVKASNIMITSRGRVKVLDFGLAKIDSDVQSSQSGSDSELATRVKTTPGIVMGTVNYMSPEQAMGKEVDHRSDIFSLGVVLYQMTTGRLPFVGDTATSIIDQITHAQPEAIGRLNYNLPVQLELIIRKALRKNRDERYQTIHDLLVDLRELRRELDLSDDQSSARSSEGLRSSSSQSSMPTRVGPPQATGNISTPPTASSAEYIVNEIKRHKIGLGIISALMVIVIGAVAFGLYYFRRSGQSPLVSQSASVPNIDITRLTVNGKARQAAISPDGKLVVYTLKDGNKQSLWIRQIATNTNIQVLPPSETILYRQTFSPDGNYVYYVGTDGENPRGAIFQIPSLGGGIPRRILTGVSGPIGFSPDGSKIAYYRSDVATGEDRMMVANADGSAERILTVRKGDSFFGSGGLSWSPDGKIIGASAGSYKGGYHMSIIGVNSETGEQIEFSKRRFRDSGRVSWLTDGSGVIVNAADEASDSNQLWLIKYPGGESHRVTSDLMDYSGTSLTADSNTLVSVQYDVTANIWTASPSDPDHGKQLTSGKYDGLEGLTTTPDGQILYTAVTTVASNLYLMNADGTNQRQLTTDARNSTSSAVSPDGRSIVFTSWRSGFPSLWRMDADGGNLKQLTDRQEDYDPSISPDGRWILFSSWRSGLYSIWKMPMEGGEPVQITTSYTFNAAFSPDGKHIACFSAPEGVNSTLQLLILPAEGGPPLKSFDLSASVVREARLHWSADGKSILYVDSKSGLRNLWSQNTEGGPPRQFTNFQSADPEVFSFTISQDGKSLILARGVVRTDVVVIRNFR